MNNYAQYNLSKINEKEQIEWSSLFMKDKIIVKDDK